MKRLAIFLILLIPPVMKAQEWHFVANQPEVQHIVSSTDGYFLNEDDDGPNQINNYLYRYTNGFKDKSFVTEIGNGDDFIDFFLFNGLSTGFYGSTGNVATPPSPESDVFFIDNYDFTISGGCRLDYTGLEKTPFIVDDTLLLIGDGALFWRVYKNGCDKMYEDTSGSPITFLPNKNGHFAPSIDFPTQQIGYALRGNWKPAQEYKFEYFSRTLDSGRTWINDTILNSVDLATLSFLNVAHGVIGGSQFIKYTSDSGRTWHEPNIIGDTNSMDVYDIRNNGSMYYINTSSGLYKSIDSGKTFYETPPPNGEIVTILTCPQWDRCLIKTTSGDIYMNQAVTGIAENNISDITVFPNPAKDYLRIELPNNEVTFEFELYNITGELVNKDSYKDQIDLTSFKSGIYVLKVYIENNVYAKRVLKL